MSDTNKTIADIIKKTRAEADYIEEGARGSLKAGETLAGTPFTESDLESALDLAETKRKEADRLEAAQKRELAQLREALEKAEAVIDGVRMMVLQGQEYDLDLVDFGGALAKCRDALAATETKGAQE